MPAYKSKLFQRNNGGMHYAAERSKAKRRERPKVVYTRTTPVPRPLKTPVSMVNHAEQKAITGTAATLALQETGQCFHLDQVTQGPGVTQRLGQKHRVTGVHIRGWSLINSAQGFDHVGYYLVWDRQPNEVLANPGDIFLGGTDIVDSFPNIDNLGRFVVLGRKSGAITSAVTVPNGTGTEYTRNVNSVFYADDFWDLTDKNLIATQVIAGNGLIGDRTSGALLMVGIGQSAPALSTNLHFNFRLYFEDV